MKSKIDKKFYKLTLEKLVIGLEEPILIKGIGKINAKIDSGNGGYNVIHGADFVQQGDILSFETEDGDGNTKRVSKKIKSTLNVNIGGGHIQERPVIELDVQFAGEEYKKIPFSVTDRGDNEHKILISKDFVGKELNALIDVTKTNISDDAVNVDYVTEGLWSGTKKVAKFAGDVAKGAVMGSNTMANIQNKASRFKQSMLGNPSPSKKDKKPEIKDELEKIASLPDLLKADKELIIKKLPEIESDINDARIDVSLNGEDVSIFKIIDYTGGTNYDDVQADKEFKEKTKKLIKEIKKKTPKEVKESTETPAEPQTDPNTQQRTENNQGSGPTPSSSTPTEGQEQKDNAQTEEDIKNFSAEELEAYKKDILARNQFIFYYVAFNKNKARNTQLADAPTYFKDGVAKEAVSTSAKSIFASHTYNVAGFEKVAKNISFKISDAHPDAAGIFVLCTGNRGSRSCDFITKYLIGAANEKNKKNKVLNKLVQIYQELQTEFRQLSSDDNAQLTPETLSAFVKKVLFDQYTLLNNEFKEIGSNIGVRQDLSSSILSNTIAQLQQSIKNYKRK